MPSRTVEYKRLILCCDGTWQASDKGHKKTVPSNVTKFCYTLNPSAKAEGHTEREIQQIVYYQSGVGTSTLAGASKYVQGDTGSGLNENVIEAYNFIVNNFEEDDEIFCFGFSRGAYTARCIAGLVCDLGVLPKVALPSLGTIYEKWREGRAPGGDPNEWKDWWEGEQRDHYALDHILYPGIKVCGVWDTVGALGIPQGSWHKALDARHQFHNPHLSDKIENAFHALALDEHRAPFSPTLWHKEPGSNTNLIQCWFPGVHMNVGGGSEKVKTTDAINLEEALADNTLAWIIDLCSPFLSFNEDYIRRFFKLRATKLEAAELYASAAFKDSYDWPATTMGSILRAPGQYNKKNELEGRDYVSGFDSTCEYMHVSVRYRYQNLKAEEWAWNRPVASSIWQTAKSYVWSSPPPEPLFELVEDPKSSDEYRTKYMWVKKVGRGVVKLPEMDVGLWKSKKLPTGVVSCEERTMPSEVLKRVRAGEKILV